MGSNIGLAVGLILSSLFLFIVISWLLSKIFGKDRVRNIYFILPSLHLGYYAWGVNATNSTISISCLAYLGAFFLFQVIDYRENSFFSMTQSLLASIVFIPLLATLAYLKNPISIASSVTASCQQKAASASSLLHGQKNKTEILKYCECITRTALMPPSCIEFSIIWASGLPKKCLQTLNELVKNGKFKTKQQSCVEETISNFEEVYAHYSRNLGKQQIEAILQLKELAKLNVAHEKKKQYAQCFIDNILNNCLPKTILGYHRCLDNDKDPNIPLYIGRCQTALN